MPQPKNTIPQARYSSLKSQKPKTTIIVFFPILLATTFQTSLSLSLQRRGVKYSSQCSPAPPPPSSRGKKRLANRKLQQKTDPNKAGETDKIQKMRKHAPTKRAPVSQPPQISSSALITSNVSGTLTPYLSQHNISERRNRGKYLFNGHLEFYSIGDLASNGEKRVLSQYSLHGFFSSPSPSSSISFPYSKCRLAPVSSKRR